MIKIVGVIIFKLILKICYKLFSKYLVAKDIVEGFEVELKVKLGVESFSSLFISLLIGEGDGKIAFNKAKKATKTWYL